jgi:hypothetical protein
MASLNDIRPLPTGTPGPAYTNSLRSYPLAERDSLLRQRCCAAALAFQPIETPLRWLGLRVPPFTTGPKGWHVQGLLVGLDGLVFSWPFCVLVRGINARR